MSSISPITANIDGTIFNVALSQRSQDPDNIALFNPDNTEKTIKANKAKAELKANNDDTLREAVADINSKISTNAQKQAQLIQNKLNKQEGSSPDISGLLKKPSIGGKISSVYMSLSGNSLTINACIFDSIKGIEIPDGFDRSVISETSTAIEISNKTLKNTVLKYLASKNHLNTIKNMESGNTAVLEETKDGIPLVTASKTNDGKIIINIDKNGVELTVEYQSDELNQFKGKN